jgi:non-homologous end joining protein Ku
VGTVTAADPTDAERRLARQLIRSMSAPFRPEAYPNEARRRLLETAWAEAERTEGPRPPTETVDDLIRQLKASVAALNEA